MPWNQSLPFAIFVAAVLHAIDGWGIGLNIIFWGQIFGDFVGFAQLARIPLGILANLQARSCDVYICRGCGLRVTVGSCRCAPTKARRPRLFGLLTCDSEWYIDIVNSQVSLL